MVAIRPLADTDAARLREIHASAAVRRWWGDPPEDFPFEEPEASRFTILVGGAVAGLIEYHEETEPRWRHASIDLFLDPELHSRGFGAQALQLMVDLLIQQRGHHRITIDPVVENVGAVRCYAKVGFQPVGVMRCYERDPDDTHWRDGLLMELVTPAALAERPRSA